ncbi:hypothetical protein LXL04_039346 [Taraxacum kok-saghyz]
MFEYYKPGSSAESMFEMENRNNDRRMWGCGKRRSSQQRDFRMEKPTARGAAASATARVAVSATARWSWWRLKSRRGEKGKGVGREEEEWISGRVSYLPLSPSSEIGPGVYMLKNDFFVPV